MNSYGVEDKEKVKSEVTRKAITLAMDGLWEEAVTANQFILEDFPDDLGANNRLGKALSELGRNDEAKRAFEQALLISPSNGISKKNLVRLARLGNNTANSNTTNGNVTPHIFIEDSGKSEVTSVVNLTVLNTFLKLAPGHALNMVAEDNRLTVTENSGEYIGQIEPRLTSRLNRLIKGGNRYEATVTSVGEQELNIIIREVYKHPNQIDLVSFPSKMALRADEDLPTSSLLGYELAEDSSVKSSPVVVKDWSDDDTEPGDDEAYSPVVHRIINTNNSEIDKESQTETF